MCMLMLAPYIIEPSLNAWKVGHEEGGFLHWHTGFLGGQTKLAHVKEGLMHVWLHLQGTNIFTMPTLGLLGMFKDEEAPLF